MAYTTNPRLPKVRQCAADLVRRGWSTRKVSRHLGYSQSAIVKWCKKAESIGYHPIPTLSSRPKHHPKELSDDMVKLITKKRLDIKRSSEVVHRELENEGIRVSISSVKRTLDRNGLLKKRSPWKRYHTPISRPEVLKQGDLVQVDTIHLMVSEKKRIYIFTLIDVYSRWCYARAYDKSNTHTSLDFLKKAQADALFTFKHLQSDNGPEFSTYFSENVKIKHRHSRVRKPNDNAHLERFNRTIQEECLDYVKRDVSIINKELPKYLKYYNEKRLHFGISLRAPMDLLRK